MIRLPREHLTILAAIAVIVAVLWPLATPEERKSLLTGAGILAAIVTGAWALLKAPWPIALGAVGVAGAAAVSGQFFALARRLWQRGDMKRLCRDHGGVAAPVYCGSTSDDSLRICAVACNDGTRFNL